MTTLLKVIGALLSVLCVIGAHVQGDTQLAFWWLPIAISAAAGGVANLLGAEDEYEADYWTREDLVNKGGYKAPDYGKMKLDLSKEASGRISDRRSNEYARSMQLSGEPVLPSYNNESDVMDALMRGYASVDSLKVAEDSRVNDMLVSHNMQESQRQNLSEQLNQGWGYDLVSGLLQGAGFGANLMDVLGLGTNGSTKAIATTVKGKGGNGTNSAPPPPKPPVIPKTNTPDDGIPDTAPPNMSKGYDYSGQGLVSRVNPNRQFGEMQASPQIMQAPNSSLLPLLGELQGKGMVNPYNPFWYKYRRG